MASQWWNIANGQQRKRIEVLSPALIRSYERVTLTRQEYNEAVANPIIKSEWIDAAKELMQQYSMIQELSIDVYGGCSILAMLRRTKNGEIVERNLNESPFAREQRAFGYVQFKEVPKDTYFRFAHESYMTHLNYPGQWNKKMGDNWCIADKSDHNVPDNEWIEVKKG